MATHLPGNDRPPGPRKPLPNGKEKKVKTEPRTRKIELDQDDYPVILPPNGLIRPADKVSPIANPSAPRYATSSSLRVTAEHTASIASVAQDTSSVLIPASPHQPVLNPPATQEIPSASIPFTNDGDAAVQLPADPTAQPLDIHGAALPRPRRNQFPATPPALKYKHDKTPGKQNEYQANLRVYNEKVVCKIWGVTNFMDAIPEEIRPKRALGNTALQYLYNLSGRVADLAKAQKLMRDEYAAHPKRDHTLGLIHLRAIAKFLKEVSIAAEDDLPDGDDDDDDQSEGERYNFEASRQEAKSGQGRGVQTRGLSYPQVQGAPASDSPTRQAIRSLPRVTAPPAALLSMVDGMNILDIRPNRPAAMDTREAFPLFAEPVVQRHQGDGDSNLANMGVTQSLDSLASEGDEVWEAAAILMQMHADDAALRSDETSEATGVNKAKRHALEGDEEQEGAAELSNKHALRGGRPVANGGGLGLLGEYAVEGDTKLEAADRLCKKHAPQGGEEGDGLTAQRVKKHALEGDEKHEGSPAKKSKAGYGVC